MNDLINQQRERIAMLESLQSETLEALKEYEQRAESAEQRVKELNDAVLEEIENRDNREEWLDKICDEIARFFGADIGEHSSANNPWLAAFEAIPVDTLNKFAIEQRIDALEEVISDCQSYSVDGVLLVGGVKAKIKQLRAKLGGEL